MSNYDAHDDDEFNTDDDYKSRTQVKKEAHALKDFGGQLIQDLNESQIRKLPLDETIQNQIISAKSMSKIAYKRQLQYVGKLLRSIDMDPVYEVYKAFMSQSDQENARFHRLEKLRDELLDKESSHQAVTDFLNEHPHADRQALRQLIRNTQKERQQNNPPKYYRELFQFLRKETE